MKDIIWQQLETHAKIFKTLTLKQLFDEDSRRAEKFSAALSGIVMDYSKNHLTDETVSLLMQLAQACNVTQALSELNAGRIVNHSENRPALHSALRKPKNSAPPEVQNTLTQMETAVEKIHRSAFTDIINIGIGGSDLGPHMASLALAPYAVTAQRLHFVSTLDAHHISSTLASLDPDKTLLIISSKSFTTQETLANGQVAKNWLGKRFAHQTFAVTANSAAAQQFGISEARILPIWEWVGGRYSIWSAIGLPLAIQIGMPHFYDFLAGGHSVDTQMSAMPLDQNPAVILALLNIWAINFFNAQTHAILPYDVRLARFPAYLQQLEMESNGKSVTQHNEPIGIQTGPIIWGEIGTNGQHAFHQLLHQGTQYIPIDFIKVDKPHHAFHDQHLMLTAHCLSQANALMLGEDSPLPYQKLTGNRPSTMITLPELNPFSLGALIALYEYKVFISSVIWDINPFDQWGVELGKKMAAEVYQQLRAKGC